MTPTLTRRDLLRAAAASAAAAVVFPSSLNAEQVWAALTSRTAANLPSPAFGAQSELLAALADSIIPRTDTPGASDVNVQGFIEVIVSDYYSDEERAAFSEGLAAIDALSRTTAGQSFAALTAAQRDPIMRALDAPTDRTTPAARTYARLKGLVVHGYFTSARVQREVLKVMVVPGRFDGSAPHQPARGGRDV